jgi:hypothetical protein
MCSMSRHRRDVAPVAREARRRSRSGGPGRRYIGSMRFDGQVWFDFSSADVWNFYRFVNAVAAAGNEVTLDWVPLPTVGQHEAMATFLALESSTDRGRFLHAMLGLTHLEGADPGSAATRTRALAEVGRDVDADAWDRGRASLERLVGEARDLGVSGVPALYRHGPAVRVSLNAAALLGDVSERASLILAVAQDDGVWGLVKP